MIISIADVHASHDPELPHACCCHQKVTVWVNICTLTQSLLTMEQVLVSFHISSCFTRFGLGKVHEARLSQPPPPPPPVEEEGVEEGMEEGKVEGRPDIDLTHWGFRYDPSITLCNRTPLMSLYVTYTL